MEIAVYIYDHADPAHNVAFAEIQFLWTPHHLIQSPLLPYTSKLHHSCFIYVSLHQQPVVILNIQSIVVTNFIHHLSVYLLTNESGTCAPFTPNISIIISFQYLTVQLAQYKVFHQPDSLVMLYNHRQRYTAGIPQTPFILTYYCSQEIIGITIDFHFYTCNVVS